jgi:hypothetical protein
MGGRKMDNVNHPSHYNQGEVECIDGVASATINLKGEESFCTGSAIKYLWRWKEKGGVEDLDKAIWYIERLKRGLIPRQTNSGVSDEELYISQLSVIKADVRASGEIVDFQRIYTMVYDRWAKLGINFCINLANRIAADIQKDPSM